MIIVDLLLLVIVATWSAVGSLFLVILFFLSVVAALALPSLVKTWRSV